MDDYNFSISDSWSQENDVPSGESISYNGRDYTPEFTTEQIFESRGDMLDWAKDVGLENGIVVVIKNSSNLKGGKLPKCILSCERGGKYKPPRYLAEGQPMTKNTGTKKCDCPFELRGKPIPPDGVKWGLRVTCGFHNHSPAEHFEGHEYPSRLKPMEKQFVVDMANSTAPREILSILKQKDPSNSTGIRSVYNVISRNKEAKRGGLTSTQYVLDQLISKGYLYDYITNPDSNKITDIVWVHPRSLELSVNFSSVFIMDATYKTNEYRMPLVEVVGITSTMLTYSLMFTYLNNEKTERLTWALDTLKKWMVGKGAPLPLVCVSDRDLALLKAIEECFPMARHILCIWHINQCVIKHCSPALGPSFKGFFHSWHSLINSSTPSSYAQKWQVMCEEYKQFPRVLHYLWDTWLSQYNERFISAWTDKYMQLGSHSSQRVESAHARLKMYLGDTMSNLQTSFDKIHKMLGLQLRSIQQSFEKSINIPRHKQLRDDIYDQVKCRISLEALEFIDMELKCAEEASPLLTGYCGCRIKITHGLPCSHDLAYIRSMSIAIPLSIIHPRWTKLSMYAHEFNEKGPQPDRTVQVVDILRGMDPHMREHTINKILDMADPSHSTVRAPAYNTEHKGRPTGRDEQSRRRIPSFGEASTSESATSRGRGRRGRGYGTSQSPVPPLPDRFIQRLPEAYHRYIDYIVDVPADGNCGFKAVAKHLGYSDENGWCQVRTELIEEIQQNKHLYDVIYPLRNCADHPLDQLNYFRSPAPSEYWTDTMTLGVVIASRYNLVLHTFDEVVVGCFTHLPLISPPVSGQERQEIAIARVSEHIVQVFLHPHYPVPPIPTWWYNNASREAKRWVVRYTHRLALWFEVMGIATNEDEPQFGGDID